MDIDPLMGAATEHDLVTPIIVPPVAGKSAIFHRKLSGLWSLAEERLSEATEVVVFGYSFPLTDFESIHLCENTFGKSARCRHVSVINPDASVVSRMGTIARNKPVMLFPSVERFLGFRYPS